MGTKRLFGNTILGGYCSRIVISILSCCAIGNLAHAQSIDSFQGSKLRFATLSSPSKVAGQNQLDIYLAASHNNFNFIKKDSLYSARYQISVNLSESKTQFYKTETVSDEVTVSKFAETMSPVNEVHHHLQFSVPANRYLVDIQVEDLESSRSHSEQFTIEVPPYEDRSVGISKPLFLKSPALNNNFPQFYMADDIIIAPFDSGFYAQVRLYQETPLPDAEVLWTISDESPVSEGRETISGDDRITTVNIHFSGEDIPSGNYDLEIIFSSGIQKAVGNWDLSLLWKNRPVSPSRLSDAIEQMEYFLPKNRFDILTSKSGDDQSRYFWEIWKGEDPTPSTSKNELMEEYYFRIDYANLKFENEFSEGWQTDRGRIFILLGPPDQIQRRYREFDTPPYEIWEYESVNRKYFFSDKNNTGEFRLVTIDE